MEPGSPSARPPRGLGAAPLRSASDKTWAARRAPRSSRRGPPAVGCSSVQSEYVGMGDAHLWLVVEPYSSEKYEFVNRDDDIPNIWKTCSKPPTRSNMLIFKWLCLTEKKNFSGDCVFLIVFGCYWKIWSFVKRKRLGFLLKPPPGVRQNKIKFRVWNLWCGHTTTKHQALPWYLQASLSWLKGTDAPPSVVAYIWINFIINSPSCSIFGIATPNPISIIPSFQILFFLEHLSIFIYIHIYIYISIMIYL